MGCSQSIPTISFEELTDAQKKTARGLLAADIDRRIRAVIPSHAAILSEPEDWVVPITFGNGKSAKVAVPPEEVLADERPAKRLAHISVREERGILVLHTLWKT